MHAQALQQATQLGLTHALITTAARATAATKRIAAVLITEQGSPCRKTLSVPQHDTAMHARLLALVAAVHGLRAPTPSIKRTAPLKALKLHGSQGSRSPLVNWYLEELNVPYDMAPPKPSDHPFGQIPYLTDGSVGVFESGAILLYIADKHDDKCTTPEQRAKFTKWVMWANSSLDPICFVENDRGQVMGTRLDQPGRAVQVLDQLLSEQEYLVENDFSVADVAVCSYLNYVPLFFPSVRLNSPNIVNYMRRCAERPAFAKAFGAGHANAVLAACDNAGSGGEKLFGLF